MICPRCNTENETDVGSCLNAGAPLREDAKLAPRPAASRLQPSGTPPKACPNCNTYNAATFKFCARCGTPLGATAPTQSQQAPTRPSQPAVPKPPPAKAAP